MQKIKLTEDMKEFYIEELYHVNSKINNCIKSIKEGEIDIIQNQFIRILLENL